MITGCLGWLGRWAAAAAVVLGGASACAAQNQAPSASTAFAHKESNAMSQDPSASRPAPPIVPPVEHDGVRYQEDMESYRHGGDQPGGYLVALDVRTGARLWSTKVYALAPSPPGVDTIGLYFKSLRLVDDGSALDIENEVGARYRVALNTHAVTELSPPPAPQRSPPKIPD
jgi:hypothetical protein